MNIYVANLNYSVSSEQLQQLFEGFGEVTSAKIILDRETGRSRGFGFVEMLEQAQAQAAGRGPAPGRRRGRRDGSGR